MDMHAQRWDVLPASCRVDAVMVAGRVPTRSSGPSAASAACWPSGLFAARLRKRYLGVSTSAGDRAATGSIRS